MAVFYKERNMLENGLKHNDFDYKLQLKGLDTKHLSLNFYYGLAIFNFIL